MIHLLIYGFHVMIIHHNSVYCLIVKWQHRMNDRMIESEWVQERTLLEKKVVHLFRGPYCFIICLYCHNTFPLHWRHFLLYRTLGGIASISDFIFSKHYGCTPRGVRGVKRSEILWGIQKKIIARSTIQPKLSKIIKTLINASKFIKKW